jgi:hypothetical protein
MRSALNDRHNFDKEIYGKFDGTRPGSKHQQRNPNPIVEDEDRGDYRGNYDAGPKRKNRMLAKGDYSDKFQGNFALQYDTYDDYRPGIKCYSRSEQDPIKPPEYIPPAQFKKTDRNPILQGEIRREPEPRLRPDQMSSVFGRSRDEDDRELNERRNYL